MAVFYNNLSDLIYKSKVHTYTHINVRIYTHKWSSVSECCLIGGRALWRKNHTGCYDKVLNKIIWMGIQNRSIWITLDYIP